MKKRKKKKPTIKEMEIVIASLIRESQMLRLNLVRTQEVLSSYIDYKKDTDKFGKYLEDRDGKENKRDSNKRSDKK